MKIIDFHTHIYPDHLAKKAADQIFHDYNIESEFLGTADILLEEGKKAGISKFVLLPISIKPEQVRSINRFIIEEASKHSEFIGFGTCHASTEDMSGEISFIKTHGLKGVKIHPDAQKFAIDDKRLYPLYEEMKGDLPVLFHCGDPRYDFSRPEKLKKVISDFPDLKVVAAHLGGWCIYGEAFEILKDTDCFFDISSCVPFMSPEKLKEYILAYGSERILFGSDFPVSSPVKEVEALKNLRLSEPDIENIAFRNALQLLNLQ